MLQGRYRILHQIGGGGMGIVYLAEDTRLAGRRYAIKEMSPAQLAPQDRTWATNAFQQEAQMLANLKHPGLTPVTDFFPEGSNWYLVMDFVEGETLEKRLEKVPGGRLPLGEALNVTRQLCDVLEYLHRRTPPVVFRDLKPGNVMLTPQGEVRLIDFGIARFFKVGQTRDTVNLGTPGYAAPELYGGLGQSDPRSDVYSLGALLLQMVTGYDPVAAVTPFPLPAPGSLMRGLPSHVEETISRATQLQPNLRHQSIVELRHALFPPTWVLYPSPPQPARQTESMRRGWPWKRVWQAPPPQPPLHPPAAPTVDRLPPHIAIPLSCTLPEALEWSLQKCRQVLIGNILRHILEDDPIEGHCTALVGYPGIGITTVIRQLKRDIIREQRGQAIVAHVGLAGGPYPVSPAEILRELRRGRGSLRFRLQNAVSKAYKQYDKERPSSVLETSRHLKAGLPVQFTIGLPLLGAFTFGNPIEYESTITRRSLPPPTTDESLAVTGQQEALRALRDLADYLTEKGVRVTLVLDKVQNLTVLEPLRPLIATPGIYTLITTTKHDFEQWQPDNLIRRVCYVPCIWDIAQEICDCLLHGRPERDSREVWGLVKYLEFYGRGIPQKSIEILEQFYTPPYRRGHARFRNPQPLLILPQDRLYEIMHAARIQTALDWDRIFQDTSGRPMLTAWRQQELDQAKMEVYAIVDWILSKARRGERFSTRALHEQAYSCNLPLDTIGINLVVRNLTEILKEVGGRITTRGFDPTGLLYFDLYEGGLGEIC